LLDVFHPLLLPLLGQQGPDFTNQLGPAASQGMNMPPLTCSTLPVM
jgi:hypothetical protein